MAAKENDKSDFHFQLLTTINNQVSNTQFEQATLFLHCLGLGGEDLDKAKEVTELYSVLMSDQQSDDKKKLAIPILQCVLLTVGVPDAQLFEVEKDQREKVKKMLLFPSLLVELCKRLGSDDFRAFKNGICLSVLKYNPSKITSRAELMKKLLQQKAIKETNVDVLKKWLGLVRRLDLVTKVDTYLENAEAAKQEEERAAPPQSGDSRNQGVKQQTQSDSPNQGVKQQSQSDSHTSPHQGVNLLAQPDSSGSEQQGVEQPSQPDSPTLGNQGVKQPVQPHSPDSEQQGVKHPTQVDSPGLPGRSLSTKVSTGTGGAQEMVTGATSCSTHTAELPPVRTGPFTLQESEGTEASKATLDQRVSQLAQDVGVSVDKLNVRVIATQLEQIVRFLPENWQQFDLLPRDASNSLEALRRWHTNRGKYATYRDLVEKFLSVELVQTAEKICRLAMVSSLPVSTKEQGVKHSTQVDSPGPPGRSLSTEASTGTGGAQEMVTGATSELPPVNRTGPFTLQESGRTEETRLTLDQRVSQLAQAVDVPEALLSECILLDTKGKSIAELLPENWKQFDWLPEDASDALDALTRWHTNRGNDATYRDLVEKFLSAELVQTAEKICRLAMRLNLRFCDQGAQQKYVYNTPSTAYPLGALPGPVPMDTLWDTTRVAELKVHFMNPDVLSEPRKRWRCGHNELEQLTTETVLAWATRGWNKDNPKYKCCPKISRRPTLRIEESHIRVMFGTGGVCWSYVGRKALDHEAEVTMYLNLYSLSTEDQESLVIHEFGHALGLEHEHQRSDVWEVLRSVCEEKSLKKLSPEHQSFTTAQERGDRVQLDYDPDSIMHYWMDHKWLKSKYRNLKDVKKMTDLSDKERKVIEGVHKRDYRNGLLAREPSQLDLEALRQAYEQRSNPRESNV